MEIGEVIPPDDSGRDAFSRFRYQAHAVFPACLKCATVSGPTAVICEHIEDVCIVEADRFVLRQIKTRNPDYGGWRLTELCLSSGALRSIVRTHRAIKDIEDDRNAVYEIQLEGFLAREDLIRNLSRPEPAPDEEVAKAVVKAFKDTDKLAIKEAREIVSRLVVFTAHHREVIVAANQRLLAALAGHLPARELSDIYDLVIELICKAMEGTLAGDKWPKVVFAADGGVADGVDLADK